MQKITTTYKGQTVAAFDKNGSLTICNPSNLVLANADEVMQQLRRALQDAANSIADEGGLPPYEFSTEYLNNLRGNAF